MAIIEEIKMNKEDEICLITRRLNKDTGKKMGPVVLEHLYQDFVTI